MTSPPCGPFVPIQKLLSPPRAAAGQNSTSSARAMTASRRIRLLTDVSTANSRPARVVTQSSDELGDLGERLPLQGRDHGVFGGIAHRDQQERALVLGPVENFLEEAHRRRSMLRRLAVPHPRMLPAQVDGHGEEQEACPPVDRVELQRFAIADQLADPK